MEKQEGNSLGEWNEFLKNKYSLPKGYELVKLPEDELPKVEEKPKEDKLPEPEEKPKEEEKIVKLLESVIKTDEEKKKEQKFWGRILNPKKLKKPESVAVIYLRKNGVAEPLYLEPKNDMFQIDGKVYHQREDCNYLVTKDKIPLAVIPEDGLIPEGHEEYYDIEVRRRCQQHQDYAIKAIRHAEIVRMGFDDSKANVKFNVKVAIGVVIMLIIGWAILKGGLVS